MNEAYRRGMDEMAAAHRRELGEMEEAHGAQMRELISEAIERTRAEFTQTRVPPHTQYAPLADNRLAQPVAPQPWGSVQGYHHSPASVQAFASPPTPVSSPPSYTQVAYTRQGAPGDPSAIVASGWQAFTPAHPAHAYSRESYGRQDAY